MNYRDCFEEGRGRLKQARIDEADLDARLLLEFICDTNRNDLLVHGDRELEPEQTIAYLSLIDRRAEHIPLQHLTGIQCFMGLDFSVNENVLIPRQDTEILVEEVLRKLHDGMCILDMCTGSGCILISLLRYSNHCQGVGADISSEALHTACENACRLLRGQERLMDCEGRPVEMGQSAETDTGSGKNPTENAAADRISFVKSDLFENIQGKFDVIVCNPPYIRTNEIAGLMPEVREHEPLNALDGSRDGLLFYRRVVGECGGYLEKGGYLFFEIGYDQARDVCRLMQEGGFVGIEVVKDYAGHDRVVYGIYRGHDESC